MKISRKADYALRAVLYISGLPKKKRGTINAVSEAENIPREFLAKILKDLTTSGILRSHMGVAGGYEVTRSPKTISFLDVIEAVDGPVHLNICTSDGPNCACDQWETCQIRDFWLTQERTYKKALARQKVWQYRQRNKTG